MTAKLLDDFSRLLYYEKFIERFLRPFLEPFWHWKYGFGQKPLLPRPYVHVSSDTRLPFGDKKLLWLMPVERL